MIESCHGCIDYTDPDHSCEPRFKPQCDTCSNFSDWHPPKSRVVCATCGCMHGRPPAMSSAQRIANSGDLLPDLCKKSAYNYLQWKKWQV